MKQVLTHIKLATISLLLFSACAQDEMFVQGEEGAAASPGILNINSVRVTDFEGDDMTRAINNGNEITFEYEDQLGILLLGADGELIKNAPFKYTEVEGTASWTNVESLNYTSKIAKAIAYFPYTDKANTAKSAEDLKAIATLQADQSKEEDFKNMDLLVDEIAEVSSATLDIQLKHVYSLVSFSAKSTLKVGEESFDYFTELSDVAFAIADKTYTPCLLGGEYVCLIAPGTTLTSETFRYFYNTGENTYVKTLKATKTLAQNSRYTFPCETTAGGESTVAAGDFYCTTPNGATAILPGSASAIPAGLTCHGIVFYTMNKEAAQAFVDNNGITNVTIADNNAPHGLVVSLKNGNRVLDASIGDANKAEITEMLNGISHDEMLGYLISKKFAEKYEVNFTALSKHTEPVAGSFTGWYGASMKEMFIIGRGGEGTVASNAGIQLLNKQIQKAQGETLSGNIPSVSFEANVGFKILESGLGTELGWKGFPGESTRPICAF